MRPDETGSLYYAVMQKKLWREWAAGKAAFRANHSVCISCGHVAPKRHENPKWKCISCAGSELQFLPAVVEARRNAALLKRMRLRAKKSCDRKFEAFILDIIDNGGIVTDIIKLKRGGYVVKTLKRWYTYHTKRGK